MTDRQKSNMRTPEKWINVDESFAKKYPSLYQTITQMPEFTKYNWIYVNTLNTKS